MQVPALQPVARACSSQLQVPDLPPNAALFCAESAPERAWRMPSAAQVSFACTALVWPYSLTDLHPVPSPQLNPGAVLNHKYTGENAVRAAGLPYCVLRPTGLTNESEPGEFLLEASQGEATVRHVWIRSGRVGMQSLSAWLANATRASRENCCWRRFRVRWLPAKQELTEAE